MIIVCNSNHSQPFLTNARMLLKKLNDDVLSYLLGWLEGFDVSNCRLVRPRFHLFAHFQNDAKGYIANK